MQISKRRWLVGALMAGMAWSTGNLLPAQQPDQMVVTGLSYSPRQSNVNYDRVEAKDEARCTGKYETRNGADGLMIYAPDGQLLRRFADSNGDRNVDQWCYFKDGIEVYRDIDSDFNGVADQYRWLGTEGIRWGIDKNEDGKIDSWKLISPEEVTQEVVEAIKSSDEERFKRLLLTDSELKSLKLGEGTQVQLADRLSKARTGFSEFAKSQKTAQRNSKWAHFAADKPGLIPEGTDGSTQDVIAYENVIAIVETDEGSQQLLIGTLVQVGNTWKMSDVPRWVSSGTVAGEGGFFFPSVAVNRSATGENPEGGMTQAMQSLLVDLDRVDASLRDATGDSSSLHEERARILRKLIQSTQGADDMGSWIRQFADSVSSAVQTGAYPKGLDRLRDLESDLGEIPGGKDFMPYVAFRVITTDNLVQLSDPKANYAVIQENHMRSLERFADAYPESPEAAEAMIQIGLNHELGSEEKEAEKWYRRVASNFPKTESGQKATGAIARLNLEGKTLNLRGKTLDGKDFQTAGPTIVHYWATWCEPCKSDMAELRKIQAKYAKQNLQIVGVNLDTDPKTAAAFLKENANKYPWAHLHEQGGFQSDLAVKLGVFSVPVTILIDGKGVVVKRTAHFSTDMAAALEQLMESAPKNQAQAKPAPNKLKK
jgi:thiol-disulfide isomerase/thioredoxin